MRIAPPLDAMKLPTRLVPSCPAANLAYPRFRFLAHEALTALQDGWVIAYNDETLEELWRFNLGTPLKGAPVDFAGIGRRGAPLCRKEAGEQILVDLVLVRRPRARHPQRRTLSASCIPSLCYR